MRRATLVCLAVLLVVAAACGGPSAGGRELETRVAELETQLVQAQAAGSATPGAAETMPPPAATHTPSPTPTATSTAIPTDTPVPPSPTATSPPPPSATPAPPPSGTRGNPVPRGQDRLAPDGWQIVVVGFNPDAWPVVQAENMFNDPPAAGNRMVMVRVGVTNVSADAEPAWVSDADFYFVGSHNILHSTFGEESHCGVIPDDLDEELFRGGYAEGNVCFQIPSDEGDLRLLYEYDWNEYLFFAVE